MTTNTVTREFQEIFRDLVVAFQPRGIQRDTVAVYHATLRQFDVEILRDAAQALIATHRFFPTVNEWCTLAREIYRRRNLPPGRELDPCEWCAGRGLIRMNYQTGEPFDVAICSCLSGLPFRKAGEDLVRLRLGLTAENRVGYIEDFDDDIAADVEPQAGRIFVYAMKFGEHVKIGFSTNLHRRFKALSAERGVDGAYIGRVAVSSHVDALLLERRLQHRFGPQRLAGEWFRADPAMVNDLRSLLGDKTAIDRELAEARAGRRQLDRRPAQDNFSVIVAVAKDVIRNARSSATTAPAELLVEAILARCTELKIAADEGIAVHALRAAEYRENFQR